MAANLFLYPANASWVLIGSTVLGADALSMDCTTTNPSNYKQIVIVFQGKATVDDYFALAINDDWLLHYSQSILYTDALGVSQTRIPNNTFISLPLFNASFNTLIQIPVSQAIISNGMPFFGSGQKETYDVWETAGLYWDLGGVTYLNKVTIQVINVLSRIAAGSRIDIYGVY